MIRLVASDIDGTLLQHGEVSISTQLFEQIRALRKKGIPFLAASGRQYCSLCQLFAPVKDEMMFLGENGGALFVDGQPVYHDVMDRTLVQGIIDDVKRQPRCEVLISGAARSYMIPKRREFARMMWEEKLYTADIVSDLEEIPEDIVKMAVYSPDGAEAILPIFQAHWGTETKVVISHAEWVDLTNCDKGTGMAVTCRTLGIAPEDIMAFGDNYNDVAMLDFVGHPYIMSSSIQELRESYPNTDRVEQILEKFLASL